MQVGVPRSVAMNLTVPVKVTAFNVELSALVANGPTASWCQAYYSQ
jgi:DNA-directed RNA polymerase II subunit RPB1